MSLVSSGALDTRNQGSTAMQWPPTPGPGCRMLTRGWRLARSTSSQTSTPTRSQTRANSLAKAMLRSRKEFSVSLVISAVVASVRTSSPAQKVAYRSLARCEACGVRPPMTRELVTISVMMRPGSTRSGQ